MSSLAEACATFNEKILEFKIGERKPPIMVCARNAFSKIYFSRVQSRVLACLLPPKAVFWHSSGSWDGNFSIRDPPLFEGLSLSFPSPCGYPLLRSLQFLMRRPSITIPNVYRRVVSRYTIYLIIAIFVVYFLTTPLFRAIEYLNIHMAC